ncbi:GPS domain-containing protein [Caerostris extrusa]|uniref:GPS domain-containing protein n=1 Tax=Caerostris extrusa TaxID=172846 RepID=A0AAV4RGF7_CAEEX|nr:GPS domain-containing protein [Caerostris extrusa]
MIFVLLLFSLSLHRFRYGYGSILHRGLDMEYQLHSRIVAVAVQTGQRVVGARASRLKVKARLAHLNHTVVSIPFLIIDAISIVPS